MKSFAVISKSKLLTTRRTIAASHQSSSPSRSDSLKSTAKFDRKDTDSAIGEYGQTSISSSNDRPDSSASFDHVTIGSRPRIQLTYLNSLDFVQSSAQFIYPNIQILSTGTLKSHDEHNSLCMFVNTFTSVKPMPLVFLGNYLRMVDINERTNERIDRAV
jgi:hypothetical protein